MPKGRKAAPNPGGTGQGVALWSRVNIAPVLLLSINGKPANDLLRVCTNFSYKRSLGKCAEMQFTFRNDDRKLLDDKRLFPNQDWQVRFGYWDDLSPILTGIIRLVEPSYALKREVHITLYDSLLNASLKSSGKNWGKISSMTIAKAIAKKHGWKFLGDDSKDLPKKSWIQPNDMNDLAYLRDLAAMVDFEVFMDEASLTLNYRKKHYDDGPRGVLIYYDDPTERSYVKSFKPKVKSLGPPQAAVNTTDAEKGKASAAQAARPKVSTGGADPYGNFNKKNFLYIPADKQNPAKHAPSNTDANRLAAVAKDQMLDKAQEAESDHPLTPSIKAGSIFEWRGIEKQVDGKWYVYEEHHTITGSNSGSKITWKRNATNPGKDNKNINNKNASGQNNKNPHVQVVASTGQQLYIPGSVTPPPPTGTPSPVGH